MQRGPGPTDLCAPMFLFSVGTGTLCFLLARGGEIRYLIQGST